MAQASTSNLAMVLASVDQATQTWPVLASLAAAARCLLQLRQQSQGASARSAYLSEATIRRLESTWQRQSCVQDWVATGQCSDELDADTRESVRHIVARVVAAGAEEFAAAQCAASSAAIVRCLSQSLASGSLMVHTTTGVAGMWRAVVYRGCLLTRTLWQTSSLLTCLGWLLPLSVRLKNLQQLHRQQSAFPGLQVHGAQC